jgi:nicotinamidase/pyrazinamidase
MGLHTGDALIIVDVQNDFLPGGALPVPLGNEVIEPLNRYAREFAKRGLPIFVTRDWHPENHCSFNTHGGDCAPHCIAGTPGADFPVALRLPKEAQTVSKGAYHGDLGFSAFEGTNLTNRLRMRGSRRLFIGGLAIDYCVRATTLDALRQGFEVVILQDAVRAVDVHPGDGARAVGDLLSLGARLASSAELLPGLAVAG